MRTVFTTTLALAAGLCSLALSGQARAQNWDSYVDTAPAAAQPAAPASSNWEYTLGAGAGYAPAYEGSDKYKALPVPVVSVDYKDGLFFANTGDGIGSYPLQGKNYKLGAAIGYSIGRDESDDRKNLNGMGDVDGSATAQLLGEYTLGVVQVTGTLSTALSGDYGTTAKVSAGSRYPLGDTIMLSGSVGTTWADSEHMGNYFGVSGVQSTRSGYRRHDAESGFKSVGFTLGATYSITDRWNTTLAFTGDQLLGDAADSPVVKDEFVPAVFLTTSYRF